MANFSDTFTYSLIVTLFGLGIVFIVLVALQYILKTMKVAFYKEKKEGEDVIQVQKAKPVEPAIQQLNNNDAVEDDELIAVITAALISSLGGRSNIVVRNIRRVDDLTPIWGKVSRTEQMANRL